MKNVFILMLSFIVCLPADAQNKQSVASLLGYPEDAKLLIMHADDLGLAHAVNEASLKAFEAKGISSASIMVPCPWFSEIAAMARSNPQYCWGLHLTLTSEWAYYKWDGVAPSNQIPSLLNASGHFYDNVPEFVEHADLAEVDREIRAQVDRALAAGIPVSHLDSHMGALFANLDLFKIYVQVGNDYDLPVMIPGAMMPPSWKEAVVFGPFQTPLDNLKMMQMHMNDWEATYHQLLDEAKPGLNEIIVHLGYDNAEMQAVMVDHPAFGATWRQQDFDYVMSNTFQEKLKEHNIILVSYKQIKDAINQQP